MDILESPSSSGCQCNPVSKFNIIKIDDDVGLRIQDLLLPYNYCHRTLFGYLWHWKL